MKRKTDTSKSIRGLSLLGKGSTPLPNSPDKACLETFANAFANRHYKVTFECPEFTSMCPVTGQPDFAHITIEYWPRERCIESKSLKLFLGSFRQQGCFAETITNRILQAVVEACGPHRAVVTGRFTARGGIAIQVMAEHPDNLPTHTNP